MSVKASFCIIVADETCLDQAKLETYFEQNGTQLLDKDYLDGELLLITPDQPEVRIEDEFYPLIQNFCFEAIFSLVENKEVEILNFSYNGSVKFSPVGAETEISGEFVPTIRVKTVELIQALYACGLQVIRFLGPVISQNSNLHYALEYMLPFAERARQAILQAGIPLDDTPA